MKFIAKILTICFFVPYRFAIQLLTPASILASINGRDTITQDDVNEVDDLFLDAKKSAKNLVDKNYLL